ncbi:hypothetical protein [Sphingobacterium pedocola]|uniref:DUF5018 domain-containing protein n=1 Tax=Sphingobacterium pedocola TaxID=2082722 RepID=A0ABR9TEZ8_9SPHI|nr:hypothetical protein [Sphingobacterium pedocola]MBE8723247.1 hypothetical protein [Sphingobacterium pedocola]
MKNFKTLFTIATCLLFVVVSCKKKESIDDKKGEMPAIAVAVPGHTLSEGIIHFPVSKETTIAIDYSVTTSSTIKQLVQSVDGIQQKIDNAVGAEGYAGQMIVDIPWEKKTIAVKLQATDAHDQVSTQEFSILVEKSVNRTEGGTSSFAFSFENLHQDAEMTVTSDGSGGFTFGPKLQAAPVLLDEVDVVYENGVRNMVRENHVQGQVIDIVKDNKDEVYTGRGGSGASYFETQAHLRVAGRPVFYMPGASNTFHQPSAALESPYPTEGNKTIYVGWYVKSKYDARLYNRYIRDINGVELNGSSSFIGPKPGERYGETVTGNGISGRITGISDQGISFEMIRNPKAPEIGSTGFGNNVVVTGETSSATFTTNTKGGESTFRNEGSNKWIRVWSNVGNDPVVRISWTQSLMTHPDGVEEYDGSYWGTTSTQMVERWAFMELLLTPDRLTAKVDGKIIHDADASRLILPHGQKVNIGMIGFNGNDARTQITQETHISDIYMDHSIKRFYLANAPTIEAATKVELQRPILWEDKRVNIKVRLGTLDPASEKIYLIYSDDINETAAVAIN